MEKEYHIPVLLNEVIEKLNIKPDGVYIDGTLGGAGHAVKILEKLTTRGKLLVFDRDINSIEYSKRKLRQLHSQGVPPNVHFYNECYSQAVAKIENIGGCDGFFLDLGISSHQIDTDSIGLSYRVNSALDMRFSPDGPTALDIINTSTEEKIFNILHVYGEEPKARKIARNIVAKRKSRSMQTTFDLREAVEPCVSQKEINKTLSRVFQAFRIVVNGELETLEFTLTHIIPLMNTGGRIVILSYHSLEDRIVKNIFKENAKGKINKYSKEPNQIPILKILTPKPIEPSQEEIEQNPRSRSAKLRAVEKM